ncbi:hypothetical protein LPUS_10891 [Lasallia pustulata]|uniref:Nucleoporin Pom152 n=1 Tax=Lasallia pustulata TaxID=136370 RepID=A0A1W5DBB4_9LECA|nr:hypothetical protein LPUS_10891 [Lasallia pustulata]
MPMANLDAQGNSSNEPMIPLHVLDAPSQRFYIAAFYTVLTAWRLYDYYGLVSDQTDSLWLFMKWVAIDGVILYGLPGLKVPWLEWSASTMTILFLLHGLLNGILMFRIPIPLGTWFLALIKVVYYRETAVDERRVRPADILQNPSLILGKQIIHILPEGSAMLNPDQRPFCIGISKTSVELPIHINQTTPILIELLRIDLDSNTNEIITVTSKRIRKLKKEADREFSKYDITSPRVLKYAVKRTGLYRLQKVVDESKLEVQRRLSDTLVVQCPSASVKSVPQDKCRGELSDFYLQADATPPLKIKYSKTINRDDLGFTLLSVHPDNLIPPLTQQTTSGTLATLQDTDVSWARTRHIEVSINETLGISGGWQYSIDEIYDALGNAVNYSRPEENGQRGPARGSPLEQTFTVHERPKAALHGCDSQHPLKSAKGRSRRLPLRLTSTGNRVIANSHHTISYAFTSQDELRSSGEPTVSARTEVYTLQDSYNGPHIREPGLYTLKSISTGFCTGEVLEPSSCLLLNPPEPDLTVRAEYIPDKCAGNSIGLMVDLDLIGTPPFQVRYNIQRKGGRTSLKVEKVDRLRGQLELRPTEAGHYTYEFLDVSDSVYDRLSLKDKNLVLEQDVKPPPSAQFMDLRPKRMACIEEPLAFPVHFSGEAPWTLEYELVHGDTRQKQTIENVESERHTIYTGKLVDGGEYTLALISVTDKSGCKAVLEQEAIIEVRRQRPKASFGQIEGANKMQTLEGKKINLPVRLTGESPWTVHYRRREDSDSGPSVTTFKYANDVLELSTAGIYELVDVYDASCPGSVDELANSFQVLWIQRPSLRVAESGMMERVGSKAIRRDVCEGDEDAVGISLTGTPPYNIKYEQHWKPERGPASLSEKKITAGLSTASIRMETSQAGLYEYKFSELGDSLYDHDRRKFSPFIVQQRVDPRPSARFTDTGKTYSYCKDDEAGDEVIPIMLSGLPPFHLEIGIKHHGTAKPEIVNVPHIESNQYHFHIPHRVLALGIHAVTIRKIRDARGCQRKTEFDGPHVQVNVANIPAISPFEGKTDYCVGEFISYTLSGVPPFHVFYTFEGKDRKATASTTTFRRIAEKPGVFTITALSDRASTDICKARTEISKTIHPMPSIRISKGRTAEVDIHEGGEAEILFEFGGTPPFEFTYTRSTNAQKGRKPQVLETKNDVSHGYTKTVRASDEGTYEVVSIRDRYCAYSKQGAQGGKGGQKLLMST